MRFIKRMKQKILEPEKTRKLNKWKSNLEKAKMAYSDELSSMKMHDAYYDGNRAVMGNPNSNKAASKVAVNVRNIVFELIESQIDSSIPMPKVTAIHQDDEELAKIAEKMLINKIKTLKLSTLNDLQERIVPVQGGDFIHVEWDKNKGLHTTLGDVVVNERHPSQVIPQPGVTEIENMDYIFILMSMTKDAVQRKYGIDVSDAEEDDSSIRDTEKNSKVAENLVTVNMAYYKNGNGGIGLFIWCDDYVLLDMNDYQARQLTRCKECGMPKVSDVCSCGSKKFITTTEDTDENGIPYYKPNCFPIILRRNITHPKWFLGVSDVDVIADQQDAIKKYGTKIQEKLLKGGSFVTMPQGVSFKKNGEEFNVLPIKDPSQKALVDVVTVQANVVNDIAMLENNYSYAKSTLGITDAYQGKYDASATSGTAKQYSINQSAGRLESKRTLKNAAYAKLYEMIFKFELAYADEPVPVSAVGTNGDMEYLDFDRRQFLAQDAAGEWYYRDEFIFETDPTSTLMANREAMWQQADMKLQSGAFGQLSDLQTNYLYWSFMEKSNYPNAGEIKRQIEARMSAQQAQLQQEFEQQLEQAQLQPLGGGADEVPVMPN